MRTTYEKNLQFYIEENSPLGILNFKYIVNNFEIDSIKVTLKGIRERYNEKKYILDSIEELLKFVNDDNLVYKYKDNSKATSYDLYKFSGMNQLDLKETEENMYACFI